MYCNSEVILAIYLYLGRLAEYNVALDCFAPELATSNLQKQESSHDQVVGSYEPV